MGTNHEDTHINESILSEEILEDQKKNRIDHMIYSRRCKTCTGTCRAHTGRFSGVIVTGSTAISGGNSAGSADRDEKTFW